MSALHIPTAGLMAQDGTRDRSSRHNPWAPTERQLDPIDAVRGLALGSLFAVILWMSVVWLML